MRSEFLSLKIFPKASLQNSSKLGESVESLTREKGFRNIYINLIPSFQGERGKRECEVKLNLLQQVGAS